MASSIQDIARTGIKIPLLSSLDQDFEFEIHYRMRQTLQLNRHKVEQYVASVLEAVKKTFVDPATAMRHVTKHEVKARVALAQEAIVVMYFDEKLSLAQCFDLLAGVLIDTIKAGVSAGDMTDGRGESPNARRWGVKDAAPEIHFVSKRKDAKEAQLLASEAPSEDNPEQDLNELPEVDPEEPI